MSVSVYKIKKWVKMLSGKSIFHVNQGVGTCYSKKEVKGYYNDLTEKVTKDNPDILVPKYHVDTGEEIYFSIGIFQYGLASYDLYLKTGEDIYKKKLLACADWAVENQEKNGGYITFAYKNTEYPYSSMAQGEALSLLCRAYFLTKDEKYIKAAKKAKDFMLKEIKDGGTALTKGDEIYFYEATFMPLVLNGWIFSLWGIMDYCRTVSDSGAEEIFLKSLNTLKKKLPDFDIGYWSKYDDGKRISSPFYHKLHIAQLKVMYDLFGDDIYKKYADKWENYQKSFFKPKKAFVKKALQKIFE